ncbi:MAG: isochorismatase family protein, partial [Desulfovibrionaceae bacterium]|nr:isochorismatase family protein [Desulfovibrionaceae bacterium]
LATDYCVAWSALDARAAGFEVALIDDACRAIDLNGSLAAAWRQLQAAGGSGLTRRRRQRCGLALTTLCYHDLFPPRKDTGMRNTMKLTAAIACGLALSACGGGGSDDNNALPAPSSSIAACFTASSNVNYSMTPTTSSTIDPMMSSMKVSSGPGTFNGQTASLVQISERVYIQDGGWNESAYAVKSDGVYSLGHRRGGYDALPGSPKEVFCTTSPSTPIPLNLQPGQFFDNKAGSETCSNGTSSMTYPTRTTLVRFETITLAGKTFSNACHFQEQELTDEGRVDLSSSPVEMWFAPGYGLIKMIDEDGYTMQYSDRDQLASPLTPP